MKSQIKMIDKIEKVAIGKIRPYERNTKKHPEEQVENIAAKIREVGFLVPIILDDQNEIVAGHARHLAALKLGMKAVPCVRAKDLTSEQIRAFRIADNKVAESEWDDELLLDEINALLEKGVDIEATGYDESEIAEMIKGIDDTFKKRNKEAKKSNPKTKKIVKTSYEYQIIIDCKGENHQTQLISRFKKEGLKCRPLIL